MRVGGYQLFVQWPGKPSPMTFYLSRDPTKGRTGKGEAQCLGWQFHHMGSCLPPQTLSNLRALAHAASSLLLTWLDPMSTLPQEPSHTLAIRSNSPAP